MITKVVLKNFKCFGEPEKEIELKPLTIFVGPNGSGKSTVLQAIGLLAQSAKASHERSGLLWDGELVRLPSQKDMFHKRDAKLWLKIGLFMELDPESIAQRLGERKVERPPFIDWAQIEARRWPAGYSVEYCKDTDLYQHTLYLGDQLIAETTSHLTYRDRTSSSYHSSLKLPSLWPDREFLPKETGRILSGNLFKLRDITPAPPAPVAIVENLHKFFDILTECMSEKLSNAHYLHDERSPDLKLRAEILSSNKYQQVQKEIEKWVEVFGMEHLLAGLRREGLGADYIDPHFQVALDLNLAGYGSRQLLPVITDLFWAKPGSLIMVEEPEISLHPESQARLMEMFAESVSEGRQVIITTHSEILLLALPRAIEKLPAAKIAVYEFEKSSEGVSIKRLEVSEDGYIRGWVPSFTKAVSNLTEEWFEKVGRKVGDEE